MGVKLREKIMKNGSSSLYLDIYHEGKRKYDFLNIHLSNKRKFSKEDRAKREIAEKLKIKKNNELLEQEIVLFENNKSDESFYIHYDKFIKENNKKYDYWDALLKKIKKFSRSSKNLSFSKAPVSWSPSVFHKRKRCLN